MAPGFGQRAGGPRGSICTELSADDSSCDPPELTCYPFTMGTSAAKVFDWRVRDGLSFVKAARYDDRIEEKPFGDTAEYRAVLGSTGGETLIRVSSSPLRWQQIVTGDWIVALTGPTGQPDGTFVVIEDDLVGLLWDGPRG